MSFAVIILFSIFGVLCFSLLFAECEVLESYNYKHTGSDRGFRRSTRTLTQKVGNLSITKHYSKALEFHIKT
jgi:hypothetical protein